MPERAEPVRPSVAVRSFRGEAAVVLAAGPYAAVFLPELGMLGASLTWHGEELLSLHGGLAAYRRRSSTGLPLLAPWANRLAQTRFRSGRVELHAHGDQVKLDQNGLPIHGTMSGRRRWDVVRLAVERGRPRLVARFDYGAHPDLLAVFPFPHVLELDVSLGDDGLRVTTALTATTRRSVPVSFGWHPYFHARGPRRQWTLRLPSCVHLELDARGIPTGGSSRQPAGDVALSNVALDDLYRLGRERRFGLRGGGSTIDVRFGRGYAYAQLYAPAGERFVAIEPMTAPTNALVTGEHATVRSGERYAASFAVAASWSPRHGRRHSKTASRQPPSVHELWRVPGWYETKSPGAKTVPSESTRSPSSTRNSSMNGWSCAIVTAPGCMRMT